MVIYYVETTIPSFYHEVRTEPEMVARKDWTRRWFDAVVHIFVHAPYKGVHSVEAQLHVINKLESVFANNPTKAKVLVELRALGRWAANGGLNNGG